MIAALFGVGVLTGGGDDGGDEPEQGGSGTDIRQVAREVEKVRELRFKEIPPVRTVTPEEARDEALDVLDEEYPPKQRDVDQEVLTLLGLLPPDTDLREIVGSIFSEEVAGYYDQHSGEMTLIGEGDLDDITLAHELTHALEDQHFGIDAAEDAFDDEQSALTALYEGTATVAMVDFVGVGGDRTDALARLDIASLFSSSSGLPDYFQRSLLFPYSAGAKFVDAIGTWGPANEALESKPPKTTEQVIHPEKYEAGEEALSVSSGPSPGNGWKRTTKGTIGEFDTAELVRSSDSQPRADRAAAGWGGGTYALWQRDERSQLKLAWRWDTTRDAAEFAAALPRYIEQTLDGKPSGPGRWRTAEGSVTVQVGPVTRLIIERG